MGPRNAALMVIGGLAALLAVTATALPAQAQTPATIVRTSPQSITIEYDRGVEEDAVIMARLKPALEAAARREQDGTMKAIFSANTTEDNLREITLSLGSVFDPGGMGLHADAVTLTFYIVQKRPDFVVIAALNVIGLPPDATEMLKAHEDGHALIGNGIAERLGPVLVERFQNEPDVADAVHGALVRYVNRAYKRFDDATEHGRKGDQQAEARSALDASIKEFLAEIAQGAGPTPTTPAAPLPPATPAAATPATPDRSAAPEPVAAPDLRPAAIPEPPPLQTTPIPCGGARLPLPPESDGSVNAANARANLSIVEAECATAKALDAARGMKNAAERMVRAATSPCQPSVYEGAVLAYGESRDDYHRFIEIAKRNMSVAETNFARLQAAITVEIATQQALNQAGSTIANLQALSRTYAPSIERAKSRLAMAEALAGEADELSLRATELRRGCR